MNPTYSSTHTHTHRLPAANVYVRRPLLTCPAFHHVGLLARAVLVHLSPEESKLLVDTFHALLSDDGVAYLAYEWREDWETTGTFHELCAACGLACETVPLDSSTSRSDAFGDDDDEYVLYVLRKGEK